MRLLLVRHGESVWNEARRFQGATDIVLSDWGRAQARALGRALSAYRPAVAYVSPLARARETAEIALAGTEAPIVALPALREFSLGEWEGCFSEEIRTRAGDPYGAWMRAPADCPPPGSEPLEAVRGRVLAALEGIAAAHPDGEDVLVVSHGGVISVYACHLLGCSLNTLWRLRVDNASVTVVQPPRIVTLNDTRHLIMNLEGAGTAPSKPPHSREVPPPSASPGAAPSKPPHSREVPPPGPFKPDAYPTT
ncbi:MAG: histidine phosphatase family protein [Candidatus Rokuibacteriota bacterium]